MPTGARPCVPSAASAPRSEQPRSRGATPNRTARERARRGARREPAPAARRSARAATPRPRGNRARPFSGCGVPRVQTQVLNALLMLGDRLLPAGVDVDRLGVGPQSAGPRTSGSRDLISERTREGLAKARASGRKLGRPKGSLGVSRLDGKEDEIRALPRTRRLQDRNRQDHRRPPYRPLQLHDHQRAQADALVACMRTRMLSVPLGGSVGGGHRLLRGSQRFRGRDQAHRCQGFPPDWV